ncbi:MAG: IS5 family transposase [Chloroflexota bacterium]|nr:IS5 family transposase [Chloroflexota bacterium]
MVVPAPPYPSDLTDAEWAILAPLIPAAKPGGRPRKWAMRAVLDAIFSLVRAGCTWRMLPRGFPPWSTVHHYCRQWRKEGIWERIHTTLRERERVRQGRAAQPTAAAIDSQSVQPTSVGGGRGYDGAKTLSGRQRHIVVDTLGLVLKLRVHAANLQDRAAGPQVRDQMHAAFPRLNHLWADQGYTDSGTAWIEAELGWAVAIVRHPPHARGEWRPIGALSDRRTVRFEWVRRPPAPKRLRGILPRRWVVERTFSWLAHSRRLTKEYKRLCETSDAFIYAAMSRLMVRRLANA